MPAVSPGISQYFPILPNTSLIISGRWRPPVSGNQEHTEQIDCVSVITLFPILDNIPTGVQESLVRIVYNAGRGEWGRKSRAVVTRERRPVELVTRFNVSRISARTTLQPFDYFVRGRPRLRRPMMSEVCRKPPWVSAGVPGIIAVSLRLQEVRGRRMNRRADNEIRH